MDNNLKTCEDVLKHILGIYNYGGAIAQGEILNLYDFIEDQNNQIKSLENKVTKLEQSQNPEGSMTLQGYIDELPG
jgi:hypothetical protein